MRDKISNFRNSACFTSTVAIICFTLSVTATLPSQAGDPVFSWMSGSSTGGEDVPVAFGNYGIKGISSPLNNPGGRNSAAHWSDSEGNFWLYGGRSGNPDRAGVFSDLWHYNTTTRQWTWVSGSNIINQPAHFNAMGQFDPDNTPGSLQKAITWIDSEDNLWLFGGVRNDLLPASFQYMVTNDIWKFDTSIRQWCLVRRPPGGDGKYGTLGVPAEENSPGAREGSFSWVDNDGKFWLLGGFGLSVSVPAFPSAVVSRGNLNDLWKYDPQTDKWAWMSGTNITTAHAPQFLPSPYIDATNTPYYRQAGSSWTDNDNNLWLFGGYYHSFDLMYFNDIWKYNIPTGQWTFVAGTKSAWEDPSPGGRIPGVYGDLNQFDITHTPGSRADAASWKDGNGNFYLFGGYGCLESLSAVTLNDIWKFDPTLEQWAWVGGTKQPYVLGLYGNQNEPGVDNLPGGRRLSAYWTDSNGKFWLYGGFGFNAYTEGELNDLWIYNHTTGEWAWISGNNYPSRFGVYGVALQPGSANRPGTRTGSVMWAENSSNVWLFGGLGYGFHGVEGYLNDLWHYNANSYQWTWIKGAHYTNHEGIYSEMGTPFFGNTPSARSGSARWTDHEGRLWLYGGQNNAGYLSDLWLYIPDFISWEWVSGPQAGGNGIYGSPGFPAPENYPQKRKDSASWLDKNNNLWLFGGAIGDVRFNDMWKFDTATRQWTWMTGSDAIDQPGVYGNPGIPSSTSTPGARAGSVTWTDSDGLLWLYGGDKYADLWKFNPSTSMWTWVDGAQTPDIAPQYENLLTPSDTTTPGSRTGAAGWIDSQNNLWLLGGRDSMGVRNDLWKYSISTSQWTWVKGSQQSNDLAVYGDLRATYSDSIPGARDSAAYSQSSSGKMWMFGGMGYDYRADIARYQGDLWMLNLDFENAAEDWQLYE